MSGCLPAMANTRVRSAPSSRPSCPALVNISRFLRMLGESYPKACVIQAVMQLSHFWGCRSDNFSTQYVRLKTYHQKCARALMWA
jgi:hypothetical protein